MLMAVAATLAAAACDTLSPDSDPVVLVTSLNPTRIAAGDTMLIGVTVHNVALATATIEAATCASLFEVLDAQGSVIGPGAIDDCGTNALPTTLRSGESFTLAAVWTGTADGSTSGSPTYLAPGSYRVRSSITIRELGVLRGSAVNVSVIP
jgi:hypothetical protein